MGGTGELHDNKEEFFMASNYTRNYNLCQWAEEDKVLRTEFNSDNAKIDAAIKAVDSRVSSLSGSSASSTELNRLQNTVNALKTAVDGKADKSVVDGKADKSALDSLKATVNQHASSIAKLGNALLYTSAYTGSNSSVGTPAPTVLTFPHKPILVIISESTNRLILVQGSNSWCESPFAGVSVSVTWSGNSVQWTCGNSSALMNDNNRTYSVVAILDAAR